MLEAISFYKLFQKGGYIYKGLIRNGNMTAIASNTVFNSVTMDARSLSQAAAIPFDNNGISQQQI